MIYVEIACQTLNSIKKNKKEGRKAKLKKN